MSSLKRVPSTHRLMAIVLILDQRGSRDSPDAVGAAVETFNAAFGHLLERPFVRTVGDEMQAVLGQPAGLAPITAHAVRADAWWIGVGIGATEPLAETARESRGTAFWAARDAVEAAKNGWRSPEPVSVAGEPRPLAEDLDAALTAIAHIVRRRTARQWESIDLAERERNLTAIAAQLRVSPQAVSQRLQTAGYEVERRLHGLTARLAEKARGA